jgi:GNAT superfamily N-acetyltransferase
LDEITGKADAGRMMHQKGISVKCEVTIEVALESDAGQVWQLLRDLAIYEDRLDEFELTVGALRSLLWRRRPVADALVARSNGDAVGVAVCYRTFPTFSGATALFIEDLFVVPDHRHSGVGTKLMQACAREGSRQGCKTLQWWALDWNMEARAFYSRIGARYVGTCIVHALDVNHAPMLKSAVLERETEPCLQ